jgi:hypothetical protein
MYGSSRFEEHAETDFHHDSDQGHSREKRTPLFKDKFVLKNNVGSFYELGVPAAKAAAKKPALWLSRPP